MERKTKRRHWRRLEKVGVVVGILAGVLSLVVYFYPPARDWVGGWFSEELDAKITAPGDGDSVPENVEVAVRIRAYDAADKSHGWLLTYCANSSCFPVMKITPTDGKNWHGVINIGPTELNPAQSHIYTIRIDWLPAARIDGILADKERKRAQSPTGDWPGIPPTSIADAPVDAVTITRV